MTFQNLEKEQFRSDVLSALRKSPKRLPTKYLYDEKGSQLFDQICELDEYYPTRTELAIMRRDAPEMARLLGPGCLLIELGSGSSLKTRALLDNMADSLAAYVPLDISHDHLIVSAKKIASSYPDVEVLPVTADFTRDFDVPEPKKPMRRRVVYFPGSTIGNFDQESALSLLRRIAKVCGPHGAILLGTDLIKDRDVLQRAYDDARGVTAAFTLNLLTRINRELGADFNLDRFKAGAVYNEEMSRVELFVDSQARQQVNIRGEIVTFSKGERVLTEWSYKYDLDTFAEWVGQAGIKVEKVWTDPQDWFAVQYLTIDN